MVSIRDEVKEAKAQHKAVGAGNKAATGRKERFREDNPPANKGYGQQVPSSAPTNARGLFSVHVDGGSHDGFAH